MKNYIIYSTLTTSFLFFVFWVLWHEHVAVVVYQQQTLFSVIPVVLGLGLLAFIVFHSLVISSISWLYIKRGSSITDGLRIGAILGLSLALVLGFQLMFNVSQLSMEFLESQMLNLSGLLVMFYVISGGVQGLIFNLMVKNKNHQLDENNIYPCRLNHVDKNEAGCHAVLT